MSKETVEAHFSSLAEKGVWSTLYKPGTKVNSETSSFLIRARRVVELLRRSGRKPKNFLDVGCGTAPLGPAIVAMGSRYTGVDFSAEMIDVAKQIMSKDIASGVARLDVGDATELDLPDATFDSVVAMGLVEYFTAEGAAKVMQEIARVMAPGGVALVTVPKRWHWGKAIERTLTPLRKGISWRPSGEGVTLRRKEEFQRLMMTAGELDKVAEKAGLERIGGRHYNTQIVSGPLIWIFPRFTYFVNRPFEFISLLPGGPFFSTGYIGMYRRR